jgi:IS30 family transposase
MAKNYKHLTTQERAVVMTMRDDQCSIRSIAKRLCRSAGTIAREVQRTSGAGIYDANLAHAQCHARRLMPRRLSKNSHRSAPVSRSISPTRTALGNAARMRIRTACYANICPRGSDLSIYSKDELDAIALSRNTRSQARL